MSRRETDIEPGCTAFADRLLAGIAPADDEALAAHVGSCAPCAELAETMSALPRLAAALHEDEASDAGRNRLGDAFWEAFPARVSGALAAPTLKPRRAWRATGPRRWLFPAAGALAAAAAVMLVVGPLRRPARVAMPSPSPSSAKTIGADDDKTWDVPTDVAELEEPALRAVLSAIDGKKPHEDSQAFLDALDDDAEGSVFADVTDLGAPALAKLSEALRQPI